MSMVWTKKSAVVAGCVMGQLERKIEICALRMNTFVVRVGNETSQRCLLSKRDMSKPQMLMLIVMWHLEICYQRSLPLHLRNNQQQPQQPQHPQHQQQPQTTTATTAATATTATNSNKHVAPGRRKTETASLPVWEHHEKQWTINNSHSNSQITFACLNGGPSTEEMQLGIWSCNLAGAAQLLLLAMSGKIKACSLFLFWNQKLDTLLVFVVSEMGIECCDCLPCSVCSKS